MIQEPQHRQPQQSPQIYNQTQVTGNQLRTVTALNTIPIAINSNQRILLITSPANRVNQTQPRIARTQIISVPFLPRSEPITLLVKKKSPIANVIKIENLNLETHSNNQSVQLTQIQSQTQTVNTLTNTDTNYSNYYFSDKNCSVMSPPMTLASMAGIQLTDADEPIPDMSGAMPTATVEEINVPVFIDEYLQQSTPTSTTYTATETTNINNNQNSNENNGISIEENGNFENFEFDIDMIVDEIEAQKYQQSSNNNHCNNNNHNNNYINNNNNMNCYENDNYNFMMINDSNLKEEAKLEEQFHVLPCVGDSEEFLCDDTSIQNILQDSNIFENEDAIDISHITNDGLTFSDILTSSQHNPMLCETISISTNNSQSLVTNAEPHLSVECEEDFKKFDWYSKPVESQNASDDDLLCGFIKMESDAGNGNSSIENKLEHNSLKRSGTQMRSTPSQSMAKKRCKLQLNISQHFVPAAEEITTPDVISFITDMDNNKEENVVISTNPDDIMFDLLNCSNSSFQSVDTEVYKSLVKLCNNDDEPPCTPESFTSCHTNHTSRTDYTTSPNSPALSTISSKKKRGRPCKSHSDLPDPSLLRDLSETERKRLEDRAKNNEASRKSRQRNKEIVEAEITKEQSLISENDRLKFELAQLEKQEKKMQRRLKISLDISR